MRRRSRRRSLRRIISRGRRFIRRIRRKSMYSRNGRMISV